MKLLNGPVLAAALLVKGIASVCHLLMAALLGIALLVFVMILAPFMSGHHRPRLNGEPEEHNCIAINTP